MRSHLRIVHHNLEHYQVIMTPPDYLRSYHPPFILLRIQSDTRRIHIIVRGWSWMFLPIWWNWGLQFTSCLGGDRFAIFTFFWSSVFITWICRRVHDLNAELYFSTAFWKRYENIFGIENLVDFFDIVENWLHEIFTWTVNGMDRARSYVKFLVVVFSILLRTEDFLLHVGVNDEKSDLEGLQSLLDHYQQLYEWINRFI